MTPAATVVIATKNRRDDLRGAVASALAQAVPVEVLVIDDGSTDGTADLVRAEFPAARLIQHERSAGYIVRRNEAARLASAPVVVSIDDDATFPSPNTVGQALRGFDHPRVGAVAVPFVNVSHSPAVLQSPPAGGGVWVTSHFIGTAHAVRRDVFLAVGGYREHLVHQGEEMDFGVRLLAAGRVVRVVAADPIHHAESARRSFARWDYYGRRNDLLFVWQNVPFPECLPHALVNQANTVRLAARLCRGWHFLRGAAAGTGWCLAHPLARQPVSREVYRMFRRLKKQGPLPLAEVDPLLSALGGVTCV